MRRILIILALCAASISASLAAESPVDFNLTLWPNALSSLDGRADVSYRWLPWLGSELSAYTDSQVLINDLPDDSSTTKTSAVTGDLYPVALNEKLLWKIIRRELDWLAFSASLGARLSWEKTNAYGYDPADYSFGITESEGFLYTFPVKASLGLRFPVVEFTSFFENTLPLFGMGGLFPQLTNYHVSGSAADSAVAATSDFEIDYELISTRFGGELSLDLKYVEAILRFEDYHYTRGVGPNFLSVIGRDVFTYTANLALSFIKQDWGSPLIGFSYVSFYDFAARAELSNQFRINLGIR